MRKIFFISVVITVLCSSSGSFAQTPKDFSDQIASSTDSLYLTASMWGSKFIDVLNGTQHYEELTPIRQELQEFIADHLTAFKATADVGGSEKLRKAVIALYEYEQKLVEKGFMPFEKLTPSSSDDQVNDCRSSLKEQARAERDFLTVVNTERRAYAKANGFSVEPPPRVAPVRRNTPPMPRPQAARPQEAKPQAAPEAQHQMPQQAPPPQQETRRSPLPHQPPPKPTKDDSEEED